MKRSNLLLVALTLATIMTSGLFAGAPNPTSIHDALTATEQALLETLLPAIAEFEDLLARVNQGDPEAIQQLNALHAVIDSQNS